MVTKQTLAVMLGVLVYRDSDGIYRAGMIGDSPCDDVLERAAAVINEYTGMNTKEASDNV